MKRGGKFTTVGGQPASNIAAVDTATGALKTGFKHSAAGQVNALLHTHGEVLVGGYFGMSRGAGADDMVLAFGGLWVAGDDQNTATQCGHEYHPGICFLPY